MPFPPKIIYHKTSPRQIHVSDSEVWAGSHSALLCACYPSIGSSIKAKITNHRQ